MRSCSSSVFVKQATKEVASAHPGSPSLADQGQTGGWARRCQAKRSVWTMSVVESSRGAVPVFRPARFPGPPPPSEVGHRRGARGAGPFPSAPSRTVLVAFATHGSPVVSSGWMRVPDRRGCLVAGAADHEGLAAPLGHEVDPCGFVGPTGRLRSASLRRWWTSRPVRDPQSSSSRPAAGGAARCVWCWPWSVTGRSGRWCVGV